jgi:hypothetical protein
MLPWNGTGKLLKVPGQHRIDVDFLFYLNYLRYNHSEVCYLSRALPVVASIS